MSEDTSVTVKIQGGPISYDIKILDPPPKEILDDFLKRAEEIEFNQNNSNEIAGCSGKRKKKDEINNSDCSGLSPPKKASNSKRAGKTKNDRERSQRVSRDYFRKRVLMLATSWIWSCSNSDDLKKHIVVNEDSCKPRKEATTKGQKKSELQENNRHDFEVGDKNTFDALTSKQNGFYYYHILPTREIDRLVSEKRPVENGNFEMEVSVDRLAMIADIYLRIMLNNDIKSSVFIKFDDGNVPALFARQTKPALDTCITGPPGRYWTKIVHFENFPKTSQHITLQRVRSGRLTQDSTFIVVGEGGTLEQMYSLTSERLVTPTRYRRCFKEIHSFIVSIPENDLFNIGWEVINETGVLDPIKTFLPRVTTANERLADDIIFINYIDMFVTMILHCHKMEMSHEFLQQQPQIRVHRTEYIHELAGRTDHPGIFYCRNQDDFITDLSMVNMIDNLFDRDEIYNRTVSDDGIYFYDVQMVTDVLSKLKPRNITSILPRYILSECEGVKEMIAYAKHTIDYKLEDLLTNQSYYRLHKSNPARNDVNRCFQHLKNIEVKCNISEYKSTYYIEKSAKLLRVPAELPTNLQSNDCILRSYRLKWKGPVGIGGKELFVMYPIFTVVFKRFSLYEEVTPENANSFPDEDFSFFDECGDTPREKQHQVLSNINRVQDLFLEPNTSLTTRDEEEILLKLLLS